MDWQSLIDAALEVRERSYSPYSRFAVGAALRTSSGSLHVGCNVENRSYGLTVCAERVAVASAVAAGHRDLEAMVIAAGTPEPVRPCGMCLDTLAEFAPDLPLLLLSTSGSREETRVCDLLPRPFTFPDS